jgi:hypothetical protein
MFNQTVYINLLKKLSLVADSKEILYAQQLSPTQTTFFGDELVGEIRTHSRLGLSTKPFLQQ